MKLQYNGDIKELELAHIKWHQENNNAKHTYNLVFKTPVTLHTSKYMSDDKTDKVHPVKKIAFCWQKEGNLGYMVGSMRRSYYLFNPQQLDYIEIVPQGEKDYSTQWQAIADSMKKYGINQNVVKSIEDHLTGKTEHIEGFQNYWKRTDKPRTMSFADVLEKIVGFPETIESGKSYPQKEWQRLQREWVNSHAIENIKKFATKSSYGDYMYNHVTKNGPKRDRSVSIQVYPDGRIMYTSASEYSGCGNGDYYMMYSPTMAFYAETD